MKKALIAVALGTFGLAGCQQAYTDPEQNDQGLGSGTDVESSSEELIRDKTLFNPLDSHLAALATEVLKCKNSFTQKDFIVKPDERTGQPVLVRNQDSFGACDCRFKEPNGRACDNKQLLQNIDDFLAIQQYDLLPDRKFGNANAVPYFAGMWTRFLNRIRGAQCPVWEQAAETINPGNHENVKLFMSGNGTDKSNNLWKIVPPKDCSPRQDPAVCAVNRAIQCAGWAGEQFIVVGDGANGTVQTDPKWWKDPTPYPGWDDLGNPYSPAYGFEHAMAEWGLAPGDRWGHVQRYGELCHKYNNNLTAIMGGWLEKVDCNGAGYFCMTACTDCPAPTPDPTDVDPVCPPIPATIPAPPSP